MAALEMNVESRISVAVDRVNAAIKEHKPIAVFGLMSGGNDSVPATYVASLAKQFDGVVHINTGIGIEATRDFVRQTCTERGWRLLEYKAVENTKADGTPDPMDYEAICLANGFPGPGAHLFMYTQLKERQLRRLERDWKATAARPVLYITGVRSSESVRRMGTVEPIKVEGRRVWCAAIREWSKEDCAEVRIHAGLKQNIVCERIGMSGECLCGAFRKDGELEVLRGWPETHQCYLRILDLQKRVREAGFPWGWGEEAPDWFKDRKRGQLPLMEPDIKTGMELCHNCTKHHGGR